MSVPLSYTIEAMSLLDVAGITAIERDSFPAPWPASAYVYELKQNRLAHYYVVRASGPGRLPAAERWWERLRRSLTRRAGTQLAGYGGFWVMGDEAHISTIAIHPQFRQHGLGGLLMVHMIEEAIALHARLVTLEVRVSNLAAQRLYESLGFAEVGLRKNYYHDNREDALIMTVEGIETEAHRAVISKWRARWEEKLGSLGG